MFYRLDVTQATFLIKDLIYQDNEQTFWEFDFRMALTKLPESVKLISPEEAAHLQKMAGQAIEEKYKREKEMESKSAWDVAQPAAPVEPVEEPEFDEVHPSFMKLNDDSTALLIPGTLLVLILCDVTCHV